MSRPRGAAVRIPPPFLLFCFLLFGWLLHQVAPLSGPLAKLPPNASRAIAGTAALLAAIMLIGALRRFSTSGQNPAPWTPTPELVSTGVYRWTRNPMYLAMALIIVSLAIGRSNLWLLLLVPAFLFLITRTAILPEEAYLREAFPESYERYCSQVRRWL